MELTSKLKNNTAWQQLVKEREEKNIPPWLEKNLNVFAIIRLPTEQDPHEIADYPMIMELYR